MKRLLFGLLVVGPFLPAIALAGDSKDEAIKKDQMRIEGTWRVTALEINGNKSRDEDVQKLTVVNGSDGTWSARSHNQEIGKGSSTIDPTKDPKTIVLTPTEGEAKGDKNAGIYELGEDTRKLCFAPPGGERPKEFSSKPGNHHILVHFKRMKAD